MSEKCQKILLNNLLEENQNIPGIFDLHSYILKKGKSYFLFDDFDIDKFVDELTIFLQNELNQITETEIHNGEIIQINYSSKKSLAGKLNLSEKYSLVFFSIKNILKFEVLPLNLIIKGEEKSGFNINSFISNSLKDKIHDFVNAYISSKYLEKFPQKKLHSENLFIEKIDTNQYILISEILGDEKLLLKLNFQSAKNTETTEEIKKLETGFLFAGENHIFLLMLNKNNDLFECKEITEPILIKKSLLKTVVTADNYLLYPKRSNADLFSDLKYIQELKGSLRIRKIAELNFGKKNYFGAKKLLQILTEKENNPFDRFLLLLNEYKTGKDSFDDFAEKNDIAEILNAVLQSENANENLKTVFEGKNLSFDDKTVLISLFSETAAEPEEQKVLLPFYENHRKIFLKKNKELIDRTVFDIKYAEFLIRYGKNRKARKILKDLLKHLPDETVSDLVPPDTLNLTSDKSGQLLKITVLDLLAEAKGKEDATEEIQSTTLLQPLNETRIAKLAAAKGDEIVSRAETANNILSAGGLFSDDNPVCNTNYNTLNDDLIKTRLQHPSITKKGGLYNFQKWISKLSEDDYSSVKKYSEKISSETYNTLFAVLKNTAEVFGIKNAEFYISKGERNNEIIGYEGNPPFVIIGYEFINKESERYMNLSEIQFAVASETAHIYFKHTKLTSKDVWRGLIEKGVFVADAALAVIPVAGFLSKTLKNVPKLNLLTKLFQGTANGIAGGKSAYDAALRLTEYYGKKEKSKKEKVKSLIAASRLMQYTADRAGLLLCGNLASAVRVVLLTEKFDNNPFEEIKNSSLKEFLLKQNSDGTYKNQKTALRIANLYSFWFSKDYSILRKEIEQKK